MINMEDFIEGSGMDVIELVDVLMENEKIYELFETGSVRFNNHGRDYILKLTAEQDD